LKSRTPDTFTEAINLFEHALALDPRSVEAQSLLADALAHRVKGGMTVSATTDIARAEALVGQALAASPRSATVHFAKGEILDALQRFEEAIPEYEAALAFNRNWADAISSLGHCKLLTGSIEEAIPLMEQAIRLSPRDPNIALMYFRIGEVHLLKSHVDEAIPWLEKARTVTPTVPWHHSYLASAYALKGETERAAAELAEARRLRGEGSYSSISRLKAGGQFGLPKALALFEATYFAGLRRAGMPEE
jgi:tetratricopeptide (TPR) repeat protein